MSEQDAVKTCLGEILTVNGYGDPTLLVQRDFEYISHEIESKTGTLISVSTLKRLLNGSFARIPQTATLNAISIYLGYRNWQEYRSSKRADNKFPASHSIKNDSKQQIFETLKKNSRLIRLFIVITGVLFAAVLIGLSRTSKTSGNFHEAQFSVRKTTRNEIPNTVIFEYDIDNVDADSFFIQQSWDRNRRIQVFKNTHTITDIYYEPGYHVAKLIANDSIIKTLDVSIPTNRWFLYAKENKPKSIPVYINKDPYLANGTFGLQEEDVITSHIAIREEMTYIYTYFPEKMEVSSDNFTFKARIKVNEVRNNFCPHFMTEIFCQRNFMFFDTTPAGCISESMIQFGENFLSGKKHDLSALGIDPREWLIVEITVKDKRVTLRFNGKKVFAMEYQNSSGLITGLGFISNGLCEIDNVELKGLDGTVVYENAFDDLP
ncbi:MAG TPA: hypothetical protein VFW11_23165 [Cyclobacteriaceae bacterium]|nr:hypothetical protein [Cyclobacteriaceae bacterium]